MEISELLYISFLFKFLHVNIFILFSFYLEL
jgi:hypothetical protein